MGLSNRNSNQSLRSHFEAVFIHPPGFAEQPAERWPQTIPPPAPSATAGSSTASAPASTQSGQAALRPTTEAEHPAGILSGRSSSSRMGRSPLWAGRAAGKGSFCSAQPPGDTGIHPGTGGSGWEAGGADPREAGASLKPYPWPQVEDQLHLPASPPEPDSPRLSCPSVLCHRFALR